MGSTEEGGKHGISVRLEVGQCGRHTDIARESDACLGFGRAAVLPTLRPNRGATETKICASWSSNGTT